MKELKAVDESLKRRTERHASWAELFFDLVVVAGVAALARVLEPDSTVPALGLYGLLFLAFWLSWTTFMLYGNATAGRTHITRLLLGMFGLGVMAVSVPGVAHGVVGHGTESAPMTVFTVAYVATRLYGASSWRRGEVVVDFPVAQYTGALLPWLASLWVDSPWKVTLWTVGVGIDLLLIFVVSGRHVLEMFQTRAARPPTRSWPGRLLRRRERRAGPTLHEVPVDTVHLFERLGLFVLIVLGEAVVQVVDTAAEEPYGWNLLVTGGASFALLAGLFGLSVVHGYAGIPHLRSGSIPLRSALGLHCLVTGVVGTVAVSLSEAIRSGSEPLPDHPRWLLCGAIAAYFTLGVITGVVSRSSDVKRTTSRTITGIALPILLAWLAAGVGARDLVVYLGLVVLAHLWFERYTPLR